MENPLKRGVHIYMLNNLDICKINEDECGLADWRV